MRIKVLYYREKEREREIEKGTQYVVVTCKNILGPSDTILGIESIFKYSNFVRYFLARFSFFFSMLELVGYVFFTKCFGTTGSFMRLLHIRFCFFNLLVKF